MNPFDSPKTVSMWRVVFIERRGKRIAHERTGPWHPSRDLAYGWARWFIEQGHHVALQGQGGDMEKLCPGLP